MRIAFLTHTVSWKGGGAFFRAYHHARHLAKRGHDVTLLSISPRRRWGIERRLIQGIEIVETPDLMVGRARTGWDPWDTLNRIGLLRRERFDVVHGCESRPAVALPALYAGRHGSLVILDWADWYGRGGTAHERPLPIRAFMEPIETFCEERFHRYGHGCVAMGDALVERARAVGVPHDRILNLLHGCDPDGVTPVVRDVARAQLGLPRDVFLLGYLGVMRQATADLLLAAYARIRSESHVATGLVLIGNPKARLDPRLLDGVLQTGWVSYAQLNLYLAACDLMLLPFARSIATDSIWPSKLNDHLSAGRPTVATRMRILEGIFREHEIGVLTDDRPDSLADACLRLVDDPTAREHMGRVARSVAEGELSWGRLTERLEAFYLLLRNGVGCEPARRSVVLHRDAQAPAQAAMAISRDSGPSSGSSPREPQARSDGVPKE